MKESLKKMLVILAVAPTISDYLEDLQKDMPNLVKNNTKKAFKDMTKETERIYKQVFKGLSRQEELQIADEVCATNIGFEKWIENNFILDEAKD